MSLMSKEMTIATGAVYSLFVFFSIALSSFQLLLCRLCVDVFLRCYTVVVERGCKSFHVSVC